MKRAGYVFGIFAAALLALHGKSVPAADRPLLSLTEEQKYTGDLILVNAEHPYHFDANKDLNLVLLSEAQSFDYPLSRDDFRLSAAVVPYLDAMIRDCDAAIGTSYTSVSSAWRSEEYQQNVRDEYAELYGEDYAEKYVAAPGCSEHHTGLSVDLGIIYDDGAEGTFSESENAVWMREQSYRYGFVRRYAEDKTEITGISNEAWHFRYVGYPHSAYMYAENLCLEEYLALLREETSPSGPLQMEYGEQTYSVFYTEETEITEPEGNYTISGDNLNGYIITVLPTDRSGGAAP